MKNINGKWKGFYEYGVGFQPPYFGERINFFIKLIGDNSEFEGFCVESAVMGDEGLKKAFDPDIDIILLDIMLFHL